MANLISTKVANYALRYFRRLHGTSRTVKGMIFFGYRILKQSSINLGMEKIVKTNGYELITMPNDPGISSELRAFKTHEPLSTSVLLTELKEGMVCLDAGANIGYYTLLERKLVGSKGKVIAVEPSPKNYSYLIRNIARNQFDDIETFNVAFSSSDGEASFILAPMSNLSRMATKDDDNSAANVIKVPMLQIDSFLKLKNLSRLDFLRMDVEGHESEIVRGATQTIRKFKPFIHIEVHKHSLGLKGTYKFLSMLRNLGYDVKYYIPRELDLPFIGSSKDIQRISMDAIMGKLKEQTLPESFHLLLVTN